MPSNASSCTKMTDMLIKFWIYSSGSKCSVVRSAESIMFFLQLQIDLFFQTTMKQFDACLACGSTFQSQNRNTKDFFSDKWRPFQEQKHQNNHITHCDISLMIIFLLLVIVYIYCLALTPSETWFAVYNWNYHKRPKKHMNNIVDQYSYKVFVLSATSTVYLYHAIIEPTFRNCRQILTHKNTHQ